MTSKIFLGKLIINDLKRRSWLLVLISLTGVFIFPVMYSMRLLWARDRYTAMLKAMAGTGQAPESLAETYFDVARGFFSPSGGMLVFIAAVGAYLAAYTGFSWLHSRQQTDFYAGMPLRRVHLFVIPYVSGILICVIPYLACALLALLGVGGVFGNVTGQVLAMAVPGLIWGIVGYLAVYTAAVFAMILAGRHILGLGMMGLIGFYGPLTWLLVNFLAEACFDTWYNRSSLLQFFRFSPLLVMARADSCPADGLILILYLVVFLVLSIALMEYRPMETAESPFVHPLAAPFVKVLTAVPLALFTGFFVGEIFGTDDGGFGWVIFWCFAAAFGYHVVYELIMSTDVKNLLGHWRSGAAALMGVAVFVCIFPLDLLRYDQFLPKEEKIEAMAVDAATVNRCFSEEVYQSVNATGPDGRSYDELLMEETLTQAFDPIYALAREGVSEDTGDAADGEDSRIVVCYRLKSGRKVYRQYQVKPESVETALTALAEDTAYREKAYPFRYLNEDFLKDVTLTGWTVMEENSLSVKFDEADRQALIDCLREDSLRTNAGVLLATEPVATVSSNIWYEEDTGEVSLKSMMNAFNLYPQYTSTLAFLKARGLMPSNEETPEKYSTLAFWVDDTYLVLEDPEDIKAFFACVQRPFGLQRGKEGATVYVEATFPGGTCSGSARIADQAAFARLLDKVRRAA